MKHRSSPTNLTLLYLFATLVPLLVMVIRPTPPARPFLVELSLALGFIGLVQLALQFALLARFKRLSEPYGIDTILRHHRFMAFVALLFVVAHPVILVIHEPAMLQLLNPLAGDWGTRTGNLALYAFVALVLLSLLRKQLRLGYEAWRVSHALLGIGTLVLAHLHIHLSGRYTDVLYKEILLLAISAAAVALIVYLRLVKPALARRQPFAVTAVRPERGNVWSLALSSRGHPGIDFKPGQFGYLKLHSPYNVRENPFSFSSSAERPDRPEFAIKELGDFTNRIGEVQLGTPAYIDGPHGSFSTDLNPAPGYVFIAGGIGIAPFMSMLRTLADRGDQRPLLLIYGEKRWDDLAFREELEELEARLRLEVVYTLDEAPVGWEGETGYIDGALLDRHLPKEGFERMIFVCGPNPMIAAVELALAHLGVQRRLVQTEAFDLV